MCMTHWCGKRFVFGPGTAALANNGSTADPLIPAKLILKVTAGIARAVRLAPPGLYVYVG